MPLSPCDRSVELGSGWASSSVNCVPFRTAFSMLPSGETLTGFYGAGGEVVLQAFDGRLCLNRRFELSAMSEPHDAHECISVGTDLAGASHVVFGAHASSAWHVRCFVGDEAVPEPHLLFDHPELRFTYPMFLPSQYQDDLLLVYREGGAWSGDIRVARWIAEEQAFRTDAEPLFSGRRSTPSCGPYLNRMISLPNGRTAFFLVWRLASTATSVGDVANVGLDLAVGGPGLHTLSTVDSFELERPVTPVHSPRVWAVPPGANLMNQCGAAATQDGRIMAVSYWNDVDGIPQYHLIWQERSAWRATALSRFSTRFTLHKRGTLSLPHSRPEILIRPDGAVLCIFRSQEFHNRLAVTIAGPPYDDASLRRTVILVDEDLGFYEPIIDHDGYARNGKLTLFVQWCDQGTGDGARPRQDAPVRLISWSAERVAEWSFRDVRHQWRGWNLPKLRFRTDRTDSVGP